MNKEIEIRHLQPGVTMGHYEPDNGTSYRAIAISWNSEVYLQGLGCISAEGYLVVNCLNCKAYLFQKNGFLVDSYIQEKLGLSQGDYPYFGDLIRRLLNREYYKNGERIPYELPF
jgi:hypothetical protein